MCDQGVDNVIQAIALSEHDVAATIRNFVRTAALARDAGYDGVAVIGSEGGLVNEFLWERTNRRTCE